MAPRGKRANPDAFIHQVAHDIRTPLTTLKGFSELVASSQELNPTHVTRLVQESQRVFLEVDAMLDCSLAADRSLEYDLVTLDFLSIVHKSIERLQLIVGSTVTCAVTGGDDITLVADKQKFIAALTCLLLYLQETTHAGEIAIIIQPDTVEIRAESQRNQKPHREIVYWLHETNVLLRFASLVLHGHHMEMLKEVHPKALSFKLSFPNPTVSS